MHVKSWFAPVLTRTPTKWFPGQLGACGGRETPSSLVLRRALPGSRGRRARVTSWACKAERPQPIVNAIGFQGGKLNGVLGIVGLRRRTATGHAAPWVCRGLSDQSSTCFAQQVSNTQPAPRPGNIPGDSMHSQNPVSPCAPHPPANKDVETAACVKELFDSSPNSGPHRQLFFCDPTPLSAQP